MKVRLSSAGIHIFDRSTGLNILLDEFCPRKEVWAKAPRNVSIALTNTCDLACRHCYAPKSRASLAPDLIKRWLKELDQAGCLGVGFGGGEPTLYPYLEEIFKFAQENTGLAVTMTTHGQHLSDELLQSIQGKIQFIRISMDGVNKTYELIRGRSFDSLLDRFQALKGKFKFGINFLVNSQTIGELDAAAKVAENFGASQLLLLPELMTGAILGIDYEVRRNLKNWIYSYSGSIPLGISESYTDGLPICDPLPEEKGLLAYAHIDASGAIKRNSFEQNGEQISNDGVLSALKILSRKIRETL